MSWEKLLILVESQKTKLWQNYAAIANAENNHNLDVDELVVAEAFVGKNLTMKRGRPRARGRFGKIIKPFSELTIKVRQTEEQA